LITTTELILSGAQPVTESVLRLNVLEETSGHPNFVIRPTQPGPTAKTWLSDFPNTQEVSLRFGRIMNGIHSVVTTSGTTMMEPPQSVNPLVIILA
jgi:hypothetical protein